MSPFRANTEMERQSNIWRAKLVGVELARRGFAPVVPHAAIAYYHDEFPEDVMMEICLALLITCDFAYCIAKSPGVEQELEFAEQQHIKVFTDFAALQADTTSLEQSILHLKDIINARKTL